VFLKIANNCAHNKEIGMPRRELELDLSQLNRFMKKEASKGKILLKEALANPRFAQVGVNLFRDTIDSCIWQLQKGEDGNDYIIRAEPETGLTAESQSDWAANADSTKQSITLSFRGMPICKFASKVYGFDKSTIDLFREYILEKTQNVNFVRALVANATGKCPDCGGRPVYVGKDIIMCNTPGCIPQQITAQKAYKTRLTDIHEAPATTIPEGKEGKGVSFYVGNLYQGELNLDKAREYEQRGIVELVQTPQGLIAKKK